MTCDTTIKPKSLEKYSNTIKQKGYDNALKFHRDFDGNRFLKHFIYLTDCGLDNGPHIYIKNSINNCPINFNGVKRLSLPIINSFYNKKNILTLTGEKGFNFFEDTTGFHAGSIPKEGIRIMMVIEYMDTKSTQYHAKNTTNYKYSKL